MTQQIPVESSKVMRKLKVRECIINELFSLPRMQSAICFIKEKLTELKGLISDIPAGLGERVFDDWNSKLTAWWTQYAELVANCRKNEPSQVSRSNGSGSFGSYFGEQQIINPPAGGLMVSLEIKSALPNGLQYIKRRIEQQFSVLHSVTSPRDIHPMKCLLLQISKSIKLFPATSDKQVKHALYSDVFSFALAKLPTELREHYRQVTKCTDSPLSGLDGLRQFIGNQIVKIYNQNFGLSAYRSIDTIGEQIKHEFDELPQMNNENCIDQAKCMLTCVTKARALLHPFHFNVSFDQLDFSLFDLVYSKLSPELQRMYAQMRGTNQISKLNKLTKVLVKHINAYYAKQRQTQAEQTHQTQSVVNDRASNGVKMCVYCQSVQHSSWKCHQLKTMTCPNCLKPGHHVCPPDGIKNAFCIECVQFGHFSDSCLTVACVRCKSSDTLDINVNINEQIDL